MKTQRKLLLIGISLIFFSSGMYSQQLMVGLNPLPGQTLKITDLLNFNLTNMSGSAIEIYATIRLEDRNSRPVVEGVTNVVRANTGYNSKLIGINFTQVIYPDEYYKGLILKSNGNLPPGDYTWNIVLYSKSKEELVSYSEELNFNLINPPILIDPPDKGELDNQNPIFTWLPPGPIPPGQIINYTIKIVEIYPAQQALTSIKSNLAVFEKNGLLQLQMLYTEQYPTLDTSKKYAWQIKAYLENTFIGESEVWEFVFKKVEKSKKPGNEMNQSFAKLKRVKDQTFILSVNELRFCFDGDYDEGVVNYKIYDSHRNEINLTPKETLLRKIGFNKYIIDMTDMNQVIDNKFYTIEVITEKGETLSMNFKYVRSSATNN